MSKLDIHFSSAKEDWGTPQAFFDILNEQYNFTLDVCADATNAKCEKYFDKEMDGLKQDWSGHVCWMNPPYSRVATGLWVKKAYEEAKKPYTSVVCLLPARTDTRFFHDYILNKAQITFVKGRLKFQGAKHGAPFPSMVVYYE